MSTFHEMQLDKSTFNMTWINRVQTRGSSVEGDSIICIFSISPIPSL